MTRVAASVRRAFARFLGTADEGRRLALTDGSRIAVVGGGPAGSFFAYFVCNLAASVDLDVAVDIFEPRMFGHCGPAGCNHCGGVVSESLVQLLAVEGINLPSCVVQRGIESYMLHTDVGEVRIGAPGREKRIASVFRGNGPRDAHDSDVAGFDRLLLELAGSAGAHVVRKLVCGLRMVNDRVEVATADRTRGTYDLVAIAAGINSRLPQFMSDVAPAYEPPRGRRTFICEFDFGEALVRRCLGDSMHIFLLDIPRLEFAALIPKGRFVTLCLLGRDVDDELVERFLASPVVSGCFPRSTVPRPTCHCFPRINASPAVRPFADRLVFIGDSGVARLYKDGIGSAYRTAKAAAAAVIFHGIGTIDFEQHYWPECRSLIVDNAMARIVYGVTALIRRLRFVRRGVLRMTATEQADPDAHKAMSGVLWDLFTGSAPYRHILGRTLQPAFPIALAWHIAAANASLHRSSASTGVASRSTKRSSRDGRP